jgi:hypothetical protein
MVWAIWSALATIWRAFRAARHEIIVPSDPALAA